MASRLQDIQEKVDSLIQSHVDTKVFKAKVLMSLEHLTKVLHEHQKRSEANEEATCLLEEQVNLLKQALSKARGLILGLGIGGSILMTGVHVIIRLWP